MLNVVCSTANVVKITEYRITAPYSCGKIALLCGEFCTTINILFEG